jgi:O-antigen ligase
MATQGFRDDAIRVRPPRRGAQLTALSLLLVLAVLGPIMSYSALPMTGEGSPLRQGAYLLTFALAIYAVRPVEDPRRLLVVPIPLLLTLGWCWLSVTWAIEPGIAARRLLLTCVVIWTLFLTVERLGYERSVTVFRIALAITLVANYLAVFGLPEFGVHQVGEPDDKTLIGNWRGIMMHKNVAGAVCAVTVLAFVNDAQRIATWLRVGVIALATIFLVFTQSKTSLGLLGFGVAAGLLFSRYQSRYRPAVIIALCFAAVFAAVLGSIFRNVLALKFTDRDAFTGRGQIWAALADYWQDHPLTGAGYGSFWNIGPDSPIYRVAKGWVTQVATGHNGFLDLLATIGLPGLLLTLAACLVIPFWRLLLSNRIPAQRGAFALSLILFCFAHNATESSLLDRDTFVEVTLIFAIALIAPIMAIAREGTGQGASSGRKRRAVPRPQRVPRRA